MSYKKGWLDVPLDEKFKLRNAVWRYQCEHDSMNNTQFAKLVGSDPSTIRKMFNFKCSRKLYNKIMKFFEEEGFEIGR